MFTAVSTRLRLSGNSRLSANRIIKENRAN